MQRLKILKTVSSCLKSFGVRPKHALAQCAKSYVVNAGVPVHTRASVSTGTRVCSSKFNLKNIYSSPGEYVFTSTSMTENTTRMSRGVVDPQTPTLEDHTASDTTYLQYKLRSDEVYKGKFSRNCEKLSCLRKCTGKKPYTTCTSGQISAKKKNSMKMAAFAIAGGCLSLKKKRHKSDQNLAENEIAALLTSENLDESDALESATCTLPSVHNENKPLSTGRYNRSESAEKMKPLDDSDYKETEENSARTSALLQTTDLIGKDYSIEDNAAKSVIDNRPTNHHDCKSSDNTNIVGTSPEPQIIKGEETACEVSVASIASASGKDEVYNLQFLFDEKRSGKKRKRTSTETENAKMDRPNYFVGIQISDKTVHNNLQSVQDAIIEGERRLKPALINLSTLHLTLIVMRVEDEALERASEVLRKCHDEVAKDFTQNPVQLEFEGLSDFKRQVLFAKIKPGDALERLQKLADLVEANFKNSGIPLPGFKEFKPHATIMKLSKAPKLRHKGIKEIKRNLYKDFVDNYFGSQYVNSLQLLSMSKPHTEDGYYHCEKEYIFDIPEGLCSCIDSQLNRTELLREEVSSSKKKVKRKFSDLTRQQLEGRDKK